MNAVQGSSVVPITIGSNISSLKAQRQLDRSSSTLATTYERLSSGQRINKASDDAAGLAVSSTLNARSRVYSQGARNTNDVVSLLSIADGALGELSEVVTRQRELAEQAANGTYSGKQRKALEKEANALVKEYNRIIDSTSFNGIKVFSVDTVGLYAQHGYGTAQSTKISLGEKLGPAAGDGTFGDQISLGGGGNSFTASTGDLNNDGNSDIVFGLLGSSSFGSLLGDGRGGFTYVGNFGGDATNSKPILQDFNGDGVLDVALLSNSGGPSELTVNLGNGDGTFGNSTTYAVQTSYNGAFSSGDVNNDGTVDLITESTTGGSLLLGRGNGTFQTAISLSHGGILRDFNNDGNLDLIDGALNTVALRISLGNGDGTFHGPAPISSSTATMVGNKAHGVDFNGDGNEDLVDSSGVLLGNGDGTFRVSLSGYNLGSNAAGNVDVGDFNGDGFQDFVHIDYTTTASLTFLGRGDGTFSVSQSVVPVTGTQSVEVFDANNDGVSDYVVGLNAGANAIRIALGNNDASGRRNPYQYSFDFSSASNSRLALTKTEQYLERISRERGNIGSLQSRLGSVLNNLQSTVIETKAAAARITDVDVADESSQLVRLGILQNAGASVLAQANLQPQIALQLLRV